MALSKQKNNQKNSNVLPNQNNIADVLTSYLNSVKELDMVIEVICNSYLFENSYDITSTDVKSYEYLLDVFIDVISSSVKSIDKKVNKNSISGINGNKEGLKHLFDFYSYVQEIMQTFIDNYEDDNKEKKVIITIKSLTGALEDIYSVIESIFNNIPSEKQLLQFNNFINKAFEILNKIIDNFADSIDLIFKKLTRIFISARFTKMFATIDTDTYKQIKENIIGVKDCLSELFTGLLDDPKLMAMEMGRLLFTQATGIKYGRGSTMDSYVYVFETLKSIFWAADDAALPGIIAEKLKVWSILKKGVKGFKGVIDEIFGTGGTSKGLLPVITDDQLRIAFNKFTGIEYGRGATMNSFLGVFNVLRKIFITAAKANIYATICDKTKAFKNIKKGAKGLNEVITALFGKGSSEKSFIPFLDNAQLKAVFNKYTGIKYGRGATMDLYSQIIVTLKSTFMTAIFTGLVAQLTNKMKTWEHIKTAVKGLEEACTITEESVDSVLLDKYLGINEIAITQFNRTLLIELRKSFLTAIFTGLIAQLTNKMNTWEHIKTAVKGLEEACTVTEESIDSVLLDKYLGINEIAITQFNRTLLIELRKTFWTAIFTGLMAQLTTKMNTWMHVHTGVEELTYFTFLVNFMTISLFPILINKETILEGLKVINRIMVSLIPVFISTMFLGVLAKPLGTMYEPLAKGLGVVIGVSLAILLISKVIHEIEKTGVNTAKEILKLSFITVMLNMLMINIVVLAIISLPITALIQPLLYGLGALVLVVASIIIFASALSEMTKLGVNFVKEFLKITAIFALLIPIFTILIAASILAAILCIGIFSLIPAISGLIIIALEINLIAGIINKQKPIEAMLKLVAVASLLFVTFLIMNTIILSSAIFILSWPVLALALLGLTVIALEINMISNLINKHEPVSGFIKLTIVTGLLWLTFKTLNIIALLALQFLILMAPLMLALLGLTVIVLEINMISNIINRQDTVKAQIKLTIIFAFLSIAVVELLALSLFAIPLIFMTPVLALAIIGIISLVLLMCLIIVPDFLKTNLINLNIVLALLLITGGILILINKAFELVSIGKVILNVLAIIGLIFVLTILFTASLLLVPVILTSSLVLAAFLVAITAVFIMALALKGVELINLNREKIEENIKIITDSVRSIIGLMSETDDDAPTINEDVWSQDKLLSLILAVPAFAIGLICVSAMLLIAAELWLLEKINLDSDKIGNNIDTINTALNKIVMFLKTDHEGLDILDIEVWKNDKLIAMFLMAPVVFSAMVVVSMLILVAAELWLLEKIKIDKTAIVNNVTTILDTINLILEKLFNKDEIIRLEKDDNDSAFKIFGKNMLNIFTERAAGVGAIIDTMLGVPMLLTSLITVGLVLFIARSLKKLTRINFTPQDKILIGDNITTIFDTIKEINDKLNEPFNKYSDAKSQEEPWWKKAWNRVVEKNDRIQTIQDGILNTGSLALVYLNTMMLSEIVDDLNKISTFNLKASDVTGKTKEIMDVCRFVADSLKAEKIKNVKVGKVEKITNVIKILSESVTSLMNITENQASITPEGQIDYCLKPIISIISFMNGTYKVDGKDYTGFSTLDIDGGWFDSGPYGKFKKIIDIEDLFIESGKKIQELTLEETKVDTIITCLLKPIQKITDEIRNRQITDSELDLIERYGTITGSLIDTTKKLTTINSVNFENYSQNVIGFIENVHKNKSADLSTLKTLVTHLNSMNKTTSELEPSKFGKYIQLFKDSNLINVSKIKTLKENLKEITDYSKNMSENFEKMSTVLSDKLVVVLEKMKTLLESMSDMGNNTTFNSPQNSQSYSLLPVTNGTDGNQNNQQIRNEHTDANMEAMLQYERIKEQNISEIRDTLDEISLVLKSVKSNTENYRLY